MTEKENVTERHHWFKQQVLNGESQNREMRINHSFVNEQ